MFENFSCSFTKKNMNNYDVSHRLKWCSNNLKKKINKFTNIWINV